MTPRTGGIVLAGGRSSRFGRDKLAEPIDGRPLLHHAIEAVCPMTDAIVVVAAPDARPELPPGVRLAHDERAFEGPLAGLAAGLAALPDGIDRVLVVAGDMPALVPAVLDRLLAAVDPAGAAAAVLAAGDDVPPLPLALDRRRAAEATARLLGDGDRRLRDLVAALDARIVPESAWRADDPDASTLRDIDLPSDLR